MQRYVWNNINPFTQMLRTACATMPRGSGFNDVTASNRSFFFVRSRSVFQVNVFHHGILNMNLSDLGSLILYILLDLRKIMVNDCSRPPFHFLVEFRFPDLNY